MGWIRTCRRVHAPRNKNDNTDGNLSRYEFDIKDEEYNCTHGLVAMTSAQHAEGRQFDPGWVYLLAATKNGYLGCGWGRNQKAFWHCASKP